MAESANASDIPAMVLNDGKEHLEFPEVEPLPPPKPAKQEVSQEETPRQKFVAIAMRVMTKLAMGEDPLLYNYTIEDYEQGRIPEWEKRAEDQKRRDREKAHGKGGNGGKPKRKGHVAWAKNSQYTRDKHGRLRKTTVETKVVPKKQAKFGGGNRFASLVRLARFKKLSSAKSSNIPNKQEEEEGVEEEVTELPKNPRFCATLSAEAQYAMLKGYEDVLLNTFNTVYADRNMSLFRVKTPHKHVNCLYLADEEQKQHESSKENTFSDLTLPPTAGPTPLPPTPGQPPHTAASTNYQLPTIPPSTGLHRTPSLVGKLGNNNTQNYLKVDKKFIPKEKQLRLTLRFEKAQDILDTVRLSQGALVTSPRASKYLPAAAKPKRKKDNPLDNYNDWSHAWSKEFKLQYRMGSHGQFSVN